MSSLSGGTKEINTSYIHLILYQAQFCESTLNLKNIFPYGISIQFDNNQEKFIEPIENINEIFNSSQNDFKYFINNNKQKHLIKINCFTKSIFIIKKKFASVKIAVNANNNNKKDKEKRVKKWYYLKNNNGEVIIKILLSIDIITIRNISNNSNNKIFFQNENDLDNNISINKPNNMNIHFNSISNNNLNGIPSSTYMSTSHYISSSNHSLKSSSTKTNNSNLSNPNINNLNNNNNLLSSIIEKDDSMTYYENDTTNEKFGELMSNNLLISIQNLFKKSNQKLFLQYKNLTQKKQLLGKEENNYFKNKKFLEEKKVNFKNNTKIFETKRQIYENNFLDLTENYKKYENNIYKSNIEKDLNTYDNDILLNINNICINQQNLEEVFLEEKMTKNYFGQYTMIKNLKENEKSAINNYYNSKGYSFESNNYKNSLYLYGNGGNSNKVLFNIMFDNRSIYTNNNFIIKPSPISFKFKQINKELSVSISDSKSHSEEKNDNKDNDKKRLTTDYSKSSLNILDDLYLFDEIPDIIRNKGSKSNNIAQNNLALKIDDICNNNNTYNYQNKFRKENKNNNKVLNNKNNNNNMNLICLRKNRKKIKINDDNNNSYYHLDNKYYTITSVDNKSKKKDNICLNKKIIAKKIENNNNNNTVVKDLDKKSSEKNINNNTDSILNKHSFKSIFKQKIENIQINKTENNIIKNNTKNNLQISTKIENKNSKIHEDKDIKNKKHNRVFKNILASNRNKDNSKREKIRSIITENDDTKSSNNSLLGINSILPTKLLSIDNNSRNFKYIKNNTNPIKNNNKCKKNRNCIKLQKKNDLNIETDNLINHFFYTNETKTKKNTNINKKISFYSNTLEQNQKKNTIDSVCSSKIITKKNTNFNLHNKINKTVYYNLINKKIENKKIINKNTTKNNFVNKIHNKKINTKNISNFDSKLYFYTTKNKTINDSDIKNNNTKNNNKFNTSKIMTETTINPTKNNKIIKITKNKNNQNCYLINNSHIKPFVNNNKTKNTILSMLNNRYN